MMRSWGGGYFPGAYAFGFPWGGLVMSAVLIGLAVFAVVAFIRMGRTRRTIDDPKERGIEILIERFARGEIDAETFRSMKAELEARN